MSNWMRIIGAFVVVLACVFFMAKGPAKPKYVAAIDYDQLQASNQNPCIVYFYHSASDRSAREMMPALDKVASHFKDKLSFFRYQLSDPEQKMPQKANCESTFTIYDGGKEIRNYPVMQLSGSVKDDEGLIMVFIKNYLIAGPSGQPSATGAAYVTADDFQTRVLGSSRPVIVDFTSAMCPPCRMLEPQFKQFASQDSQVADFYFCDHDSPANYPLARQYSVSATPTVMLFVNGQPQGRYSGAFENSDFNEGRILLLLQPYL